MTSLSFQSLNRVPDEKRSVKVGNEAWMKHVLSLSSRRFTHHHTFMAIMWPIIITSSLMLPCRVIIFIWDKLILKIWEILTLYVAG